MLVNGLSLSGGNIGPKCFCFAKYLLAKSLASSVRIIYSNNMRFKISLVDITIIGPISSKSFFDIGFASNRLRHCTPWSKFPGHMPETLSQVQSVPIVHFYFHHIRVIRRRPSLEHGKTTQKSKQTDGHTSAFSHVVWII